MRIQETISEIAALHFNLVNLQYGEVGFHQIRIVLLGCEPAPPIEIHRSRKSISARATYQSAGRPDRH